MNEETTQPRAADPRRPVSVESLPWESWSKGTRFGSRMRDLSRAGGEARVGVILEELDPGKQSVPLHYHMLEEEHLYVLDGAVTLLLGDERIPMRAGDFVTFPAGQKVGHALVNEGDRPCRYLMIGEDRPDEVVVYPQSGKVGIRALRLMVRPGDDLDYWDGEEGA